MQNESEEVKRAHRLTAAMTKVDTEADRIFIDEITEAIKEDNPKIPEPVFRELFLPAFANPDKDTKIEKDNFLSHWIGLVGGPTTEVDLVNMKGDVILTVPPIFDSSVLNESTTTAARIKSVFLNLAEDTFQQRALHEFQENSTKELNALLKSDREVQVNRWAKVFEHYGLIKEGSVNKPQSNNNNAIDDFDFS